MMTNRNLIRTLLVAMLVIVVISLIFPLLWFNFFDGSTFDQYLLNGSTDANVSKWGFPMLAILTLGEAAVIMITGSGEQKTDTGINLFFGMALAFSAMFVRAVQWVLFCMAYDAGPQLFASGWHSWILGFVLCDFVFYWFHRAGHEINMLWASHYVHHSSEQYNFGVGVRNNILHLYYRYILWVPLCFFGFHPVIIIACDSFSAYYQFLLHTKAVGKLGWLEYIFCTPSNHRVHHGRNDEYIDKNYGGVFIFWDRIFGTFTEEQHPVDYGLKKPMETQKPLRMILAGWKHIFRRLKSENPIQVIFGKP